MAMVVVMTGTRGKMRERLGNRRDGSGKRERLSAFFSSLAIHEYLIDYESI